MIKFKDLGTDFEFTNNQITIAYGTYEDNNFCLFYKDDVLNFGNAMQAFSYLNSIYHPRVAKQQVHQVQSSSIDSYKKHPALKDITKDNFHAYVHSKHNN